jgi:hypothetical protein
VIVLVTARETAHLGVQLQLCHALSVVASVTGNVIALNNHVHACCVLCLLIVRCAHLYLLLMIVVS